MSTVREMPAEHAILALLALAQRDGAGYGYDLARHFSEGQPLATILRLEPGMLYHHLKKLDRLGWVEADLDASGPRPPRRLYRLTALGERQLGAWLQAPVAHTREIRLEFLVKLYFARLLRPERIHQLLAEQRETLDGNRLALEAQIVASSSASADDAFTRQVLTLRLAQTSAALCWLETISDQVIIP